MTNDEAIQVDENQELSCERPCFRALTRTRAVYQRLRFTRAAGMTNQTYDDSMRVG